MKVSYKKLWKLLIDIDIKKEIYKKLQVLVLLQFQSYLKMSM